MKVKAFITHKRSERFADCQDRLGVNPDTKSVAVSDGMGQTWMQKIWAQLLVEEFVMKDGWLPNNDSIKPLCEIWRKEVVNYIQLQKNRGEPKNVIFRNERNLAVGRSAGATFVGVRFNGNEWNGSVLGDSCLIEWDGKEAIFHTSQNVEAFDSYPDYFDSNPLKEGKGTPKNVSGFLEEGDYLFLVSDPFSVFLSKHNKTGDISQYIKQLLTVTTHQEFENLVSEWRNEGMHDDDTTLVVVEKDNSDDFSIITADDIKDLIDKQRAENTDNQEDTIEQAPLTGVQENEEGREEIVHSHDINSSSFSIVVDEFEKELQFILHKKYKQLKNMKYKSTMNAAKEALRKTLDKIYRS